MTESGAGEARACLTEVVNACASETTVYRLAELDVGACRGCFGCWVQTPGVCVIDDVGRRIASDVIGSDLVIFLTPITFGGYSSELKKAVDRLIPLILPYFTFVGHEVHHMRRYRAYPRLLGIGLLNEPNPEQEETFRRLVRRNSINLHAPEFEVCIVREDEADLRGTIERSLAEVMVE